MDRSKVSRVEDVVDRIEHVVRNHDLAERMVLEVMEYNKSHDPSMDLKPEEQRLLYRDEHYGEGISLSKKKKLDIQWSDHAEYRSDLRDVDPKRVNETIADRLRKKLPNPDSKKLKFIEPGVGTMVVDYDLRSNPAEAEVITVWAREAGMNDRMSAMVERVAASAVEHRYEFWRKEVEFKMRELSEKLRQHDEKFSQDSDNWGYVGDVTHVAELLDEVLDGFGK
jgi:hypothetical protein